jgi:hypothetical protein
VDEGTVYAVVATTMVAFATASSAARCTLYLTTMADNTTASGDTPEVASNCTVFSRSLPQS